jgi:hypothetical protein
MSRTTISIFWMVVFCIAMPLGVVLSTHMARRSFEKVKLRDQTITVKGYAEKPITSDLAQWFATVTVRQTTMTEAAYLLEAARERTLTFLSDHGFARGLVTLSPVSIRIVYVKDKDGNSTNQMEGYVLSQGFAIASRKVETVAAVARDASRLIAEGIELDANAPCYLFTKLDDVKLEMIGQATLNARQRAEKLISGSTSTLGPLRSASQGVFQITPPFSNEVSDSGSNDTDSIDKVIKAVVTVEYAIQ